MTWLSRFLSQHSNRHHARNRHAQQTKKNRRQAILEELEGRRLLSGQAGNVTVVYNPTTLGLSITGDNFNDGITVAMRFPEPSSRASSRARGPWCIRA